MQQQLADMECASLQWDVHWLSRLSPLAHCGQPEGGSQAKYHDPEGELKMTI